VISRIRSVYLRYPRQFWLIAGIMLLAWTFHSMLWPYLLIYSSEKLSLSLTAVAGLLTINAGVGLVTTFLGGAIADRFGRKWVMGISFLFCAVSWYFFQYASTLTDFILLMALNGASTPIYRLAADSMMADLVPGEKRIEAYSILRMGNNIGVALGPAIGGFTAAVSYSLSFKITGLGIFLCGILVILFSSETIPALDSVTAPQKSSLRGYWHIFKDGPFISLIGAFTLNRIASATIWLMLGIYVKTNYGISESLYGFIPTTNAVMVVLFQVLTTSWVKKHDPRWMLVLGSAFYGVALLGVAFGRGFWAFWLCMVIATIGEMIAVPTSTTTAAAMAPAEMRGRYMSLYTLTAGVGSGVGPLLGGILSDAYGPAATWYGGGLIGFASALAFMLNLFFQKSKTKSERMA
jgi:predicted MFS family arabinose efflux permease